MTLSSAEVKAAILKELAYRQRTGYVPKNPIKVNIEQEAKNAELEDIRRQQLALQQQGLDTGNNRHQYIGLEIQRRKLLGTWNPTPSLMTRINNGINTLGGEIDEVGTRFGNSLINVANAVPDTYNYFNKIAGNKLPSLSDIPTLTDYGDKYKIGAAIGSVLGIAPLLFGGWEGKALQAVPQAAQMLGKTGEFLESTGALGKLASIMGKNALSGAVIGGATADTGHRLSGLELGGIGGAASPLIAKGVNLALQPVAKNVMDRIGSPLTKLIFGKNGHPAAFIPNDQEGKFFNQVAKDLQLQHNASALKYGNAYDEAESLANSSTAKPRVPGSKGFGYVKNFESIRNNYLDELGGLYNKNEEDYLPLGNDDKSKLQSLINFIRSRPLNNLGDYIKTRKLLSKSQASSNITPGTDLTYNRLLNQTINQIKGKLDSAANEYVRLGDNPYLKMALNKYREANQLFAHHQNRFYELPIALRGGMEKESMNLINGLKNGMLGDPVNADILRNFIPSANDLTTTKIDKLGEMLGDNQKAKDVTKALLFSKYSDDTNIDKVANKFNGLSSAVKNHLFSPDEQKIIQFAKKIKARQNVIYPYLHYGIGGSVGLGVGHFFGHPLLGALMGIGAKGMGNYIGGKIADRYILMNDLDNIGNTLDHKLLDEGRATKYLNIPFLGTTNLVTHKQAQMLPQGITADMTQGNNNG